MADFGATVLIPALNEERSIAATVRAAWRIPGVTQVIVVDDGSTDQTSEQARAAGALVIKAEKNLGKGGALNLGLPQVRGDFLLLLDADLGTTAYEGKKLLTAVVKEQADLVIGRFPTGQTKSGFGFLLFLAQRIIRKFTGLNITAPLSGQRALNQKALQALGGKFDPGFGVEVAMIIDVARKGLVIKEIPVVMAHRKTKRDLPGFLHRGRQFRDVCAVVFKRLL